ncbi:hypothetical protein IDH44_03835 [Paenibacillus sp. IB182496]|uniref:Extracellular solute-binding protein n=1 Tax=Paenibacillus sabuli TaxID=2772509 RepID=A0A927BRP3_9BACL|nr:hypothetical protein [Paenibacillus sabuli]MBD2844309.1 hypothetical protein [Paenibacillus sabuli]
MRLIKQSTLLDQGDRFIVARDQVFKDPVFRTDSIDYVGRIESLSKAIGDGSEKVFSIMQPPAGPGGESLIIDGGYMLGGFAVSANAENLDAALHLIDYLYSDEGMEVTSWGREGVSYTTENGKRKLIGKDHMSIRGTHGILSFGSYGRFDTSAALTLVEDQYFEDYELSTQHLYPAIFNPSFNSEEQNILSVTLNEINTIVDSNLARFILGDRPLSEWDTYVKEIQNTGLQQVLDIYETAWDRQ